MKIIATVLFFLLSLSSIAQTYKATLVFRDSHREEGFVKSFIENRTITSGFSGSLEHELNLDDKTIKFKPSESGEFKAIPSDEIDEIILHQEKGNTAFKHILLKELSGKGEPKEGGRMVFLPYVKKGKINIYGIKYTETGSTGQGASYFSKGLRFYYQNANEDYALNYQNIGLTDLMNMESRIVNPFKDLFKDCPAMVNEMETMKNQMFQRNKEAKQEYKDKQKEFKNLPKEEQEKLINIHKYTFYAIERMFDKYEACQ
ncbi:hypothetical protein [Flavobacterium suncheonense]|nr:hypothetical protein [Flavobacterium suncheonense]